MNLRGELVPVIDLGPIVGLGQKEIPATLSSVLVLSVQASKLALAVDRVKDIVTFAVTELKPPPLSLEPERAIFIRGEYLIDRLALSLLDMEKIVADSRFVEPA
jgi:chemotaxis signal transduction protein